MDGVEGGMGKGGKGKRRGIEREEEREGQEER